MNLLKYPRTHVWCIYVQTCVYKHINAHIFCAHTCTSSYWICFCRVRIFWVQEHKEPGHQVWDTMPAIDKQSSRHSRLPPSLSSQEHNHSHLMIHLLLQTTSLCPMVMISTFFFKLAFLNCPNQWSYLPYYLYSPPQGWLWSSEMIFAYPLWIVLTETISEEWQLTSSAFHKWGRWGPEINHCAWHHTRDTGRVGSQATGLTIFPYWKVTMIISSRSPPRHSSPFNSFQWTHISLTPEDKHFLLFWWREKSQCPTNGTHPGMLSTKLCVASKLMSSSMGTSSAHMNHKQSQRSSMRRPCTQH